MKAENPKKKSFIVSLAYIPDVYEEDNVETISGGIVRLKKGNYLHIPLMQLKCKSKDALIKELTDLADELWERTRVFGE